MPDGYTVKGKVWKLLRALYGGDIKIVIGYLPGQLDIILKLLSVDPSNYQDAPPEARSSPVEAFYLKETSSLFGWTLLSPQMPFLNDLLKIGYQSRLRLFDLNIVKPDVLYSEMHEIETRITIEGFDKDLDGLFDSKEEIPGFLLRGTRG
ncbi:hypothetical protein EYZ11_004224 [Aspergillus tanneri]|uniref:Uncharacterized protein n=1 Tax=Aspergillus tanneri TaxID=1220188 RepID=A0A4S3JL41_9EURO|nr:hypothetical protein EYZ11_004224 [Aspergillus tanneri]